MLWLGIDTSNGPLSVALVRDGQVVIEETTTIPVRHSLRAMPVIERLMKEAKVEPKALDAIAVSEGPGSYTGVRIGVTIAKTLAWTLHKPLIGIPSIRILAANFYEVGDQIICPLIDARRQNVYSSAYTVQASTITEILIDEGHYAIDDLFDQLERLERPILFTGADVLLYKERIEERFGERATIAPPAYWAPRATQLVALAMERTKVDNAHTFVPEYSRLAEAEANWQKACKRT